MVGYGNVTKGYRLYDAIEGKIIYSHDVQFNEKVKECPQNIEDTAKSDYQLTVEFSEALRSKWTMMSLNLNKLRNQVL